MAKLLVVRTCNRFAFDVHDGPSFESRINLKSVKVVYKDVIAEGWIRTYQQWNTIRGAHTISEQLIEKYHLIEGSFYECQVVIDNDSHIYIIKQ